MHQLTADPWSRGPTLSPRPHRARRSLSVQRPRSQMVQEDALVAEARAVGLGWDAIAGALPTRPLEEIQRRHAARSCSQAGPLDGSCGAELEAPSLSAISHYAMSAPLSALDCRCQLLLSEIRSQLPRKLRGWLLKLGVGAGGPTEGQADSEAGAGARTCAGG